MLFRSHDHRTSAVCTPLRKTSSQPAIPVAQRGYAGDARHDWQQPEAFRHAWGRRMCMHGHRHAAGTGNPRPGFSALDVQRSTSKRKESCRDEEMDAGGRVDSRLRVGVGASGSIHLPPCTRTASRVGPRLAGAVMRELKRREASRLWPILAQATEGASILPAMQRLARSSRGQAYGSGDIVSPLSGRA